MCPVQNVTHVSGRTANFRHDGAVTHFVLDASVPAVVGMGQWRETEGFRAPLYLRRLRARCS